MRRVCRVLGAILVLGGRESADGLHYVYGLLPLVVSLHGSDAYVAGRSSWLGALARSTFEDAERVVFAGRSRVLEVGERRRFFTGLPVTARGAGTGLSGGAIPVKDGVLIVLTRLNRILEIDLDNQRVVVEPCVTNAAISKAVGPTHFYPPDPSSQVVSTIGGNVAENSGGLHCFKYGFTTNYVTGLEIVLPDGVVMDPELRTQLAESFSPFSTRIEKHLKASDDTHKLVLRLLTAPSADLLEQINLEFTDILVEGQFTLSGPLADEMVAHCLEGRPHDGCHVVGAIGGVEQR